MDQRGSLTYITDMTSDGKVTIKQLGGLKGFMRSPGLFITALTRGRHVGADDAGNQFYERPGRPGSTRPRRWVAFNGPADASSIGPRWHAWLHYVTDAPLAEEGMRPWMRPHLANRTGTAASYRPAGHDYTGGVRAPASADYEAWSPDDETAAPVVGAPVAPIESK
jgi:NADH:ubiquinone oxidoreductase subunit